MRRFLCCMWGVLYLAAAPLASAIDLIMVVDPTGSGQVYPGNQTGLTTNDHPAVYAAPFGNYRFKQWLNGGGAQPASSISQDTTLTLTGPNPALIIAKFESTIPVYSLTVTNDGHGATSPSGTISNMMDGTVRTISATPFTNPAPGYVFDQWTPAAGIADPNARTTSIVVDNNKTVTALFKPLWRLTITNSAGPESAGYTTNVVNGTLVTVAVPNETVGGETTNVRYRCGGWTGGTGSIPEAGVYLSYGSWGAATNSSIEWTWIKQYRVSIVSGPGGLTVPLAGENWCDEGSVVTLTAVAAAGCNFVNWTVGTNVTTETSRTLTINAPLNAVAIFAVDLDEDADDDGLSYRQEVELGTDPVDARSPLQVDDDSINDPAPYDSTMSDPLEDGTHAHPYDAIQKAVDVATNGQVVLVLDGVYSDFGNFDISIGAKSIRVISLNGPETAVLDTWGAGRGFWFHLGESSNSMVSGFTIRTWKDFSDFAGIVVDGASPRIENCRLFDCGDFGVKCLNGAGPTLSDLTVESCKGGILCQSNASPVIERCNIVSNAADHGGGICAEKGAAPVIVNTVIARNTAADRGGGLFVGVGSSITSFNCTVVNNSAGVSGGGLFTEGTSYIRNLILWTNTAPVNPGIHRPSGTVNIAYSDLQQTWPGTTNVNPLFRSGSDYAISTNSPCIDTGTGVGAPTNDVRCAFRPVDGDNNGSALTDMGAYEYQLPSLSVSPTGNVSMCDATGQLFHVWVNNPEGGYLTYSWTWDGSEVGSNASSYAHTTTWGDAGSHTLRCYVSDDLWTNILYSQWDVAVVADLATNNIPKWWLVQYGLTNFDDDAMRDVDHDGMLTWQEWVAGCDPTNINSVFRFTSADGAPGLGMVVQWPSISNRFYGLARSTNLMLGTNGFFMLPGASNMPATPTMNSYTDGVQGVGPYFYRIDVHE